MTTSVGIDLGGTNLRTAVVDGAGEILVEDRRPAPTGWEALRAAMVDAIGAVRAECPDVAAVGVGADRDERVSALVEAGVDPGFKPHQLRHYAATRLISDGVEDQEVSRMLGHAHVGITLSLYRHARPERSRAVADYWDQSNDLP